METSRMVFRVAPWGEADGAEIVATAINANKIQDAFSFVPNDTTIPLDHKWYKVRGRRGFDLDRAAKNLLRRQSYSWVRSGELILVTALPYSEPGAKIGFPDPLDNGLYFLEDAVVSKGKTAAIVSTFIWDRLPIAPDLPPLVGEAGRRVLPPYLMYSLAMVALSREELNLEVHEPSRGCPSDYNRHVRDIDLFFEGGSFCSDCLDVIKAKSLQDKEFARRFEAINSLLSVAAGRPGKYNYDFAFSFAGADRLYAERLATMLRNAGFKIFYDYSETHVLLGKDLERYFRDTYGKTAERCIVFASPNYLNSSWAMLELGIIRERARREKLKDYLVPIELEPAPLPGLESFGYLSARQYSMEQIAEQITKKFRA